MSVYLGSSKVLVSVGEHTLSLQSPSDIVNPIFQGVLLITSDDNRILDYNDMYLSSEVSE